jgi:DNA-binding response OmpR family regulator
VLDMSKFEPERRALIVEDEFLIAHDLEMTMHELGFAHCDIAPNGRKAQSLSMSDAPDIALVDVCLEGGREGIEIARWLREMFEVPVVFVTAYSDEATVERINQVMPGAPVLPKPVYADRLAAAISEASGGASDSPVARH